MPQRLSSASRRGSQITPTLGPIHYTSQFEAADTLYTYRITQGRSGARRHPLPPSRRHLVVLSILCFLIHLAQAPMLPSGAQWFAEFCFFLTPVRHLRLLLLKVGKVEVQAD